MMCPPRSTLTAGLTWRTPRHVAPAAASIDAAARWRWCRSLLAALACVGALFGTATVHAQSEVGLSSGYAPFRSLPFFILADTQFGSDDVARLRVEVPAQDGGRAMLEAYGGIDIALYRVPRPLAFLQAQKNLHRVDVRARVQEGGLANTLAYLWDNAWKKSRFAWRDLFSTEIRREVTSAAPQLRSRAELKKPTEFRPESHYRPLEGFEQIDRFRYPIWQAKPIAPPADVDLAGSSSEFIPVSEGNVHVPLGKLRPGLYLAEAIIGQHRAVTLVFVSDTVAVTKLAAGALTTWTADRRDGRPVADTQLLWTDGTGTLKSARSDDRGLATLRHASPEHTWLLGEDPAGGVFVSENFYYDSEIHDTKLYAVTDRPLYRPGDLVRLKFLAREFVAANQSRAARAGALQIAVNDPNGTPVLTATAALSQDAGADTAFRLPDNATAGGYEVRIGYEDRLYAAAFRVAEYVKPHFDIELLPDAKRLRTGEPVAGVLRLRYPDGKPVAMATVELSLRAQTLTMVEGELRYSGLFPVQLTSTSLKTDANGDAAFVLPAAKEPSRLILSALATDGAAYRVRATRELLVERAAANWKLRAERAFTMPSEPVRLVLEPEAEHAAPPVRWEIVRLEDQQRSSGDFDPGAREWAPRLDQPGSYSLLLRDADGNIVGASAHWVGGNGLKAAAGSIEMVADRPGYRAGDVAEVLITFPQPVDEALLTLERDGVEATALLSRSADWLRTERIAPNQWRARIPVRDVHAPNITFSVVVVKDGDYVFQNAGLVVEPPRIALEIVPERETVKPGELVTVDIRSTLAGEPVPAVLTVSVVDEMVYALQPEIAPGLIDFFNHLRRNNVRTSASLSFIAYDEAVDHTGDTRRPPAGHQYAERGVKVIERPRRDDTDTAAWEPALRTDAEGRARLTFRMPDALSRWRITVRAAGSGSADGIWGQRSAQIWSDQALYAKWTSPTWLREGDAPIAALAVFNNTDSVRSAEVTLALAGETLRQPVQLARGVNYVRLALPAFSGRQAARVEILEGGTPVDALETVLDARPARWRGVRERRLGVDGDGAGEGAPLLLPADARDLSLRLVDSGAAHFLQVAEDLVDYPWGCTEQTASRLIPLALVTPLLAPEGRAGQDPDRLWQMLHAQRLRLAALAGPQAVFGWWGNGTEESALMTAYAYYADWYAARTLGIALPAEHWEQVLEAYREHGEDAPLLHRALSLWFAQEIGLPVRTQTEGLLAALADAEADASRSDGHDAGWSPILAAPDSTLGLAHARVLASILARHNRIADDASGAAALGEARITLMASARPTARALLLLAGQTAPGEAEDVLARVAHDAPTMDRALTLVWTRQALGGLVPGAIDLAPAQPWQRGRGRFGQTTWQWPAELPLPTHLTLAQDAAHAPLTALLRYEADEASGVGSLPVTIERRLYRLERGEKGYAATPLGAGEALSPEALYLDEVVLTSDTPQHNGLLEVALPPGATVERGTWGVDLVDGDQVAAIERARAEERPGRYGVPVEHLEGRVVLRHLLRVAQSGRFVLPPTRFHRMYQPELKAFADKGDSTVWQVR